MSFDFNKAKNNESVFAKIHKDTQASVIIKHYNDYLDYKQINQDYFINITDNTITCSDIKSLTFLYYASHFRNGFDLAKCDDYSIFINNIKSHIMFPGCLAKELWGKVTESHKAVKRCDVDYHNYNVKAIRDCIRHFVKNIANNAFIVFDLLTDMPVDTYRYGIKVLSKKIHISTSLSDIFSLFAEFLKQTAHSNYAFISAKSLLCLAVLVLNDKDEYIITDIDNLKYIIDQLIRINTFRTSININKEESNKFFNNILSCVEKK